MKILYISSLTFRKASSASIRNIGLINGLVEKGHQVDLLTIKYPTALEDTFLKELISKKVHIYKSEISILNKYFESKEKIKITSNFTKSNLNILKNAIKTFYFFPDTDKEWIKNYNKEVLKNEYDLIISSSDTKTSHYIAESVTKKKSDIPWFQIWGDPWEDDINLSKILKYKVRKKEKSLLKRAKKIFYVSKPTTEVMKTKYKRHSEKIFYLGRSYSVECQGNSIGSNKDWIISYTGSLSQNRKLENLILSIKNYNEKYTKKIKIDFYGNYSKDIYDYYSEYDFLNLNEAINFKSVLEVYKKSDVLLFIDNGNNTSQIPGKLYDYFGTDRPILALVNDVDTAVATFIKETNRCIVQENNQQDINFDFLSELKREKVLKEYSGEAITKRMFLENTK